MRTIRKYFCKHPEIKDTEFCPSPFNIRPLFIRNCINCGKYLGNYSIDRFIDINQGQIEYMKSLENEKCT